MLVKIKSESIDNIIRLNYTKFLIPIIINLQKLVILCGSNTL